MSIQLDPKDRMILLLITQNKSMAEMAKVCIVGTSAIQFKINRLVENGYVIKPETRKARSLTLSELGKSVLINNGVILTR